MRKPRILIVENSVAVTGALKSIVRSSVCLRQQFEFVFLMPSHSSAIAYVRHHEFDVHTLPLKELRRNFWSLLVYLPALVLNSIRFASLVKRLNIDLINVNDFYNLVPPVYRFFGGRRRYVCYVRMLPNRFPAVFVSVVSRIHGSLATRIIAVSQAVASELPPLSTLIVVPNELPVEQVPYSGPEGNVILYPANYTRGKGQEYALTCFEALHQKHSRWTLRFVGGDMGLEKNRLFKEELRQQAIVAGIEKKVIFGDFAEDINAEYLRAALMLNFSESESFSLTCVEAMYCGRAVLATRSGGPAEFIDHGITGVLVPVGDITAMTTALDELLTDNARREALGRRAYDAIRQTLSYERTIGLLSDVYFAAVRGIK